MKIKLKSTLLLIVAITMAMVLTACGGSNAPTFGTSTEDYDGFEYLEESSMPGHGDSKKIQAFIPKDVSTSKTDQNLTCYKDGFQMSMTLVSDYYIKECNGKPDKILKKIGRFSMRNINAVDSKAGKVKIQDDDGKIAKQTGYIVTENLENKYKCEYITDIVTKVDDDNYVEIVISISPEIDKKDADGIIKELSQYYETDVDWDKDKAKKLEKKFNDNPVKNQKIYFGSLVMEIPKEFKFDFDFDKKYGADGFRAYGPDSRVGMNNNIYMISKYVGSTNGKTNARRKISELVKKIQPDAGKITFSEEKSRVDKFKNDTYKMTAMSKGRSINGYAMFNDYDIYLFFSVSDSKAGNKKTQNIVDHAFETLSE